MGHMMSLNEQLIHSMKKMRLDNSSICKTGCVYDAVHVIPDETTPSSPFRKYLTNASSSDYQLRGFCSENDSHVRLMHHYQFTSNCDRNNNQADYSIKCDTPILQGMHLYLF